MNPCDAGNLIITSFISYTDIYTNFDGQVEQLTDVEAVFHQIEQVRYAVDRGQVTRISRRKIVDGLEEGLGDLVGDGVLVVVRQPSKPIEQVLHVRHRVHLLLFLLFLLILSDIAAADVETILLREHLHRFFGDLLDGVSGLVAMSTESVQDDHPLIVLVAAAIVRRYREVRDKDEVSVGVLLDGRMVDGHRREWDRCRSVHHAGRQCHAGCMCHAGRVCHAGCVCHAGSVRHAGSVHHTVVISPAGCVGGARSETPTRGPTATRCVGGTGGVRSGSPSWYGSVRCARSARHSLGIGRKNRRPHHAINRRLHGCYKKKTELLKRKKQNKQKRK